MSKHIKKSFQADPFGWIVGVTAFIGIILLLNTCVSRDKPQQLEPIDAVPVSE